MGYNPWDHKESDTTVIHTFIYNLLLVSAFFARLVPPNLVCPCEKHTPGGLCFNLKTVTDS